MKKGISKYLWFDQTGIIVWKDTVTGKSNIGRDSGPTRVPWYVKVKVLVSQLCPTFWDPMDYTLSGFSVHGTLQARILEWVAIPFSKGSSWPKDWTCVSCIADSLLSEPPGKLQEYWNG